LAEMDNVMNKGGVHFVFDKTQQNSLKVWYLEIAVATWSVPCNQSSGQQTF
jgi:hypothetical protein